MISLLSAVLLSAAVDYETLAKPLPAVLADLSKATGVEMRASDALREEKLVVRVKDVEADELRRRLAEAVAGKWAEKDGVFTLQIDNIAKSARYRATLDKRVAQIREAVGNFPKIGNSIENMRKYHSSGHTYRAAHEIVSKMDLSSMAEVPIGYRRVYSTAPTAAQSRIKGIDLLVYAAQAEHNRIAEIALSLDVDEPAVGTHQYKARQALIKRWDGPIVFQLVCGSNESGLQAMARFISNGNVLDVVPISLNWQQEPPISLPDSVDGSQVLPLTKVASGMARLMASNLWDGSTDRIEIDPETIAALRKPTQVDPLTLHYSEMLLEIGRRLNWQVVACVRDEMVPMLQNDKPTLRSALDTLVQTPYTTYSFQGDWLIFAPTEFGSVQQIDRSGLEAFMLACEKKMPDLETLGKLASQTPAPFTTPLMMPYLKVGSANFGGGETEWLELRFFSLLTERQRLAARNSGTLQISEFVPKAREILARLTFDVGYPMVTDGRGAGVSSSLDPGPSSEVTDMLPAGLTDGMKVSFEVRNTFAVLPTPKTKSDISPYPMPVSSLAYNATVDPKVFINGVRPVFPTFRIGTMNRIAFSMPIQGTLQLQGFLYEFLIDNTSQIYDLGSAPKPFKDAFEKALKERGG